MNKLLSLISVSMILFAGQKAAAVFNPGEGPKPHTLCIEGSLRDAGLQILLTNVETETKQNTVRADVYEMNIRGSEKIASRSTTSVVNENSVTYLGDNFSLAIENEAASSEHLRSGELVMILENGQQILKTLKCDGIMHVMGAI